MKVRTMGSKERWDQLPHFSFDDPVPIKLLKAVGKKKSKSKTRAVETTSQPNIAMSPRMP